MANYGFLSPGALGGNAIAEFLTQRDALERQRMLDELAKQQQAEENRQREAQLALQRDSLAATRENQAFQRSMAERGMRNDEAQVLTSTLRPGQELTPEAMTRMQGTPYEVLAETKATLPSSSPALGTSDPGGRVYGVYQGTAQQQAELGQRSARQRALQVRQQGAPWAEQVAAAVDAGGDPSLLLREDPAAAAEAERRARVAESEREHQYRMEEIGAQNAARERLARTGAGGGTETQGDYVGTMTERTLDMIDAILPQVIPSNTGAAQQLLGGIGGTSQGDFRAGLEAIVANIGFRELSEMRAASKTGGALGQVSDFENRMLQSALGSLKGTQSAEALRTNLLKVRERLESWERAKANPEAYIRGLGMAPGVALPRPMSSRDGAAPPQAAPPQAPRGFRVLGSRPR